MPKNKGWKKTLVKKKYHEEKKKLDPTVDPVPSLVVGGLVPTDRSSISVAASVTFDVDSSQTSSATARVDSGRDLTTSGHYSPSFESSGQYSPTFECMGQYSPTDETAYEIRYDFTHEFSNELALNIMNELAYELCNELILELKANSTKPNQGLSECNTQCTKFSCVIKNLNKTDTRERSFDKIKRNCEMILNSNKRILAPKSHVPKGNGKFSPISDVLFTFGTFNQADKRFDDESRGRQCVCNSLVMLAYNACKSYITETDLDNILVDGDNLFKHIIGDLKRAKKFISYYLNFDELPSSLVLGQVKFHIQKLSVLNGVISPNITEETVDSLHTCIENLFLMGECGIILVNSVSSAIFRNRKKQFQFFDSHSHGRNGLSEENGKSVLATFKEFDSLMSFLYSFYSSLMIGFNTEFNILPVKLLPTPIAVESYPALSRYFEQQSMSANITVNTSSKCTKVNRKHYMKQYMKKYREDDFQKQRDKKMTLKGMHTIRKNAEHMLKNRVINRNNKQKARQNTEQKLRDRQMTLKSMQKSRENPTQKLRDRQMTLKSMQKSRENPTQKSKDRQMTLISKQKSRENPTQKLRDRQMTLKSMQKSRENPTQKLRDRQMTLISKQKSRENPTQKLRDRQMTLKSMQKSRENPTQKLRDRQMTLITKQKSRENPTQKLRDRQMTLNSMQKSRENPTQKLRDRQMTRKSKLKARQNPMRALKERAMNAQYMKKVRQNPDFTFMESAKKAISSKGHTIEDSIIVFHKSLENGFSYICTSCNQMWPKTSVVQFLHTKLNMNSEIVKLCRTRYKSVNNTEWICRTCFNALSSDKIPKLSVANLFYFPEKPEELNLHQLEERLISLRIPFMQIRELPRGRQLSVKGNVVNCPVDIQPTINALPRQLDDNITIPVKLKRKQIYKKALYVENVRPNVIIKALAWLLKNSEIYKNSGVKVSEDWLDNTNSDFQEFFHVDNSSKDLNEVRNKKMHHDQDITNKDGGNDLNLPLNENRNEDIQLEEDDKFSEIDPFEVVQGNADTLLDNFQNVSDQVYSFAPGEGQIPLSLYQDEDAEYMSFPSIYCGQRRPKNEDRPIPVHYSEIAKWELRSVDRRAATNVPNLFFKLKKLQLKQISDKVNLAVRRFKTMGKRLTVGQVLDQTSINQLVNLDEGYYIFRTLRNSPAYLSKRKKDLFAMIRQLGLPTWFISLSAADTRWKDLLKMLANLHDGKVYTNEDIENMSWEEITSLIQGDPVSCSRHFNHRVNQFFKLVLNSPHNPIGDISDYFCRTEFQNRGSPHVHILVWINNAPKYAEDSNEVITEFINRYVSCTSDVLEQFKPYVQLQTHKHSKTCRKKGKPVCRFGFPHPPMSQTQILEPLDEDPDDEYKNKYKDIQKTVDELQNADTITFDEFLNDVIQMREEDYIKCIRSSLHSPKVFLKRNLSEVRTNPYMKVVLQSWNANHDIQFVLDPYACAMYIVSYISKSERGMSTLLEQACKEARQGNNDIRKQVRQIGNKFLNAVETSAQEAAYLCLQLPLTHATREVIFINTSPPTERTFLLKSKSSLEELPENSTDIEANNIIKRYSQRPKQLEKWCLADYASKLNVIYPKKVSEEVEVDWDKNDDANNEDSDSDIENKDEIELDEMMFMHKINITLPNGTMFKERRTSRVLRYVKYSLKIDAENYYRERLLLFLSWRNEEMDLLNGYRSYEEHYNAAKLIIDNKLKRYECIGSQLDEAEIQAQKDFNDEQFDLLAPQTQQVESEDLSEEHAECEKYIAFNPTRPNDQTSHDIGIDLGLGSHSQVVDIINNPSRLSDEDYYNIMRSLNMKQREYLNHILYWVKTRDEPVYSFLSGGAGVGKSVLIRALYQALIRFLCAQQGDNPDDIRVVLCAPTGKAAFNINGSTIHSTFKIPASQGFNYKPLDSDSLNALRVKYKDLSILIIDEVSMVGCGMLNYVSERLKQIKGSNKAFGNISVILIGDLFQLKPVFDGWIFQNLSKGYGPLATNLWKDHFQMYELTQIMRQKDDAQFAEILNRLREGNHTDNDISIIQSCIVDNNQVTTDSSIPHLYSTREGAKSWNSRVFELTSSQKMSIPSVDDVKSHDSAAVKQNILKTIPPDPAKTSGLLQCLSVAVSLRYDLTANIDTSDGLTNGASCTLKMLDFRLQNRRRPSILWVQFDDSSVGTSWRKTYSHLYTRETICMWTPIFDLNRSFMLRGKTISRIQFPLTPSAAKTIHKAQGSTLDEVYIDLTMRNSVPHIHYVALSRARTMSGLHIIELNESKISVDKFVTEEMKILRKNPMPLCYTPIYKINTRCLKIAFNNARSLNLHYPDIKNDPNVTSCDIMSFAETKLCLRDSNEHFHIDGYTMFRNDAATRSIHRPARGLAAYIQNNRQPVVTVYNHQNFRVTNCEALKLDVLIHNLYFTVITMYIAPVCTLDEFKSFINLHILPVTNDHANIVILGDFNFDISNNCNTGFIEFMQTTFNVQQIVSGVTTDYQSTLDLIFTNRQYAHKGIVECFWSDHKLVYVSIDLSAENDI